MSITEEYVQRAEECDRLAATCRSQANREILQRAAAQWRKMAEQAAVNKAPSQAASAPVPSTRPRQEQQGLRKSVRTERRAGAPAPGAQWQARPEQWEKDCRTNLLERYNRSRVEIAAILDIVAADRCARSCQA
jgi:hypothetical protein